MARCSYLKHTRKCLYSVLLAMCMGPALQMHKNWRRHEWKACSLPTRYRFADKKDKKGKKTKSETVIIVHEDKFTQIPEIIYEEDENGEEKGPAEPGEAGWEYIRINLPDELQISLASLWENTERVYIGDFNQVLFMNRLILNPIVPAKCFFKNLMKLYTDKPDDKQLYLRKFQQTYNEFDDEIRSDEEFKAELHCRVNEMREKLIEICDRKMMGTEQERCFLLEKGWATKQLIQLINSYINALQLEIDRHVDTFVFLNDYYMGIITKMPNDNTISKEILSRFELEDSDLNSAVYNVLVNVEDDADPFAETLEYIFGNALIFANKCQNWTWSIFDKAKYQFLPNGEKEKGKTAKKEKKSKKGEKNNFEPAEDVKKNLSKLLDEWACALKGETARLSVRINLLKFVLKQSIDEVMKSLREDASSVYEDIRSKYRKDIHSITEACNFLRRAIETESPIQEELLIIDSQFFVDANTIHFPDPSPPEKLVLEIGQDFVFTVGQLEYLTDILMDLAPSGYIPERSFVYLLQDMIADEEKVMTPKSWAKLSTKKVEAFSKTIFANEQLIQWKHFIIYNFMVPFPSVEELLELRTRFVEHDIDGTEIVNEEQFEEIRFWFETVEDDNIRIPLIKNLLFKLYKVTDDNFNYTAMLFDFCKGSSTPEGLAKALALSSGRALCWDDEVGKKFVEDALEKRRIHEEEVRIRNEERQEAEEFAKILIEETIDQTVHKCESIIIEDLEPVKEYKIENEPTHLGNTQTQKQIRVDMLSASEELNDKHEENDKKFEEENDGIGEERDDTVNENLDETDGKLAGKSSQNNFANIEIGFETNPNPNLQYFIQLDDIVSVLTILLSWSYNVQHIEEKSFCEILEEIYRECKNPQFNDEVLSHELLNNPKLLNLLSNTSTFLVKNPPEIVIELLAE